MPYLEDDLGDEAGKGEIPGLSVRVLRKCILFNVEVACYLFYKSYKQKEKHFRSAFVSRGSIHRSFLGLISDSFGNIVPSQVRVGAKIRIVIVLSPQSPSIRACATLYTLRNSSSSLA
jgi:hypothetical protein